MMFCPQNFFERHIITEGEITSNSHSSTDDTLPFQNNSITPFHSTYCDQGRSRKFGKNLCDKKFKVLIRGGAHRVVFIVEKQSASKQRAQKPEFHKEFSFHKAYHNVCRQWRRLEDYSIRLKKKTLEKSQMFQAANPEMKFWTRERRKMKHTKRIYKISTLQTLTIDWNWCTEFRTNRAKHDHTESSCDRRVERKYWKKFVLLGVAEESMVEIDWVMNTCIAGR